MTMGIAVPIVMFLVFLAVLRVQRRRGIGPDYGRPAVSGVVRALSYPAWVCVAVAVVFGGSHEVVAGISLAAAGVLLLAGFVRALAHPEELTAHGGDVRSFPGFVRALMAILGAGYLVFGIFLAAG